MSIHPFEASRMEVTARTRCMQFALFKEAQNQYLDRKSSIVVSKFHRDSSISFMSKSSRQPHPGSLFGATENIRCRSIGNLMI